jgi:hypothetical protein
MQEEHVRMDELFRVFMRWFKESKQRIVLVIDEVDSATNNQVFLDFLAQLRSLYLKRERSPRLQTNQSVILAGVTDVRYLKSIIRDEGLHRANSPWNIAADFDVDMSFSESDIQGMLEEYEADHHTGMDTQAIARLIREYTGGYPYLVSRICQLIDERVAKMLAIPTEAWAQRGVNEAGRLLLSEDNTLFQTVTGKLSN